MAYCRLDVFCTRVEDSVTKLVIFSQGTLLIPYSDRWCRRSLFLCLDFIHSTSSCTYSIRTVEAGTPISLLLCARCARCARLILVHVAQGNRYSHQRKERYEKIRKNETYMATNIRHSSRSSALLMALLSSKPVQSRMLSSRLWIIGWYNMCSGYQRLLCFRFHVLQLLHVAGERSRIA